MVTSISLNSFKRIDNAELDISKITVLVGGNNSGKSCILQGVHFGIALSQSRRIAGADQFPPEKLRYCPTDNFLDLRNGQRLTEGPSITFSYKWKNEDVIDEVSVNLQRGRNGVVKAQSRGGILLDKISDPKGFFSIYVPGLAGITIREEYRSELVVSNGIARGDANLYLRNVLLRLERDADKKKLFDTYIDKVFPGISLRTEFLEPDDLWIRSMVYQGGAEARPLDMVGTGLLQAIQLIAYVANYEPKLLLLDEPDAHLHPSNQRLLAETLSVISNHTDTKIILATHSRHLIDALSEEDGATLFWIKDGKAKRQDDWADIAVLMDLGALDKGERFLAGDYKYLIWTEDTEIECLSTLLKANGVDLNKVFIFSYKTSSKLDAAVLMSAFIKRVRPGVRIIIHRDRDFMSDSEIDMLMSQYNNIGDAANIKIFVTKNCDIESYFVDENHVSFLTNKSAGDERIFIESIMQSEMNKFLFLFRDKRDEIKRALYKKNPDSCPKVAELAPGATLPMQYAHGKTLYKLVRDALQVRGINGSSLCSVSPALADDDVKALFV